MPARFALGVVAFLIVTEMAGSPALAQACQFGLRPSKETLEPLGTAVSIVNGAVDDPELTLVIADKEPPSAEFVPVYVVRQSEAKGMVAHVREDCRAILVGSHEFEEAFRLFSKDNVLIEGHEADMLALLLLHELGHIHHGHYGQFIPAEGSASLNLDETASKVREEEADAFAARILREEFEAMGHGEAHIPATMLIPFIASLSLAISTQASLDCFGCRPLGSPDIFWDHSQSHENLEYRLLKMNHAIVPSDTSQRLLDDYELQREESSQGGLSIIGPYGTPRLIQPGMEEYEVFENLIRDLDGAQQD